LFKSAPIRDELGCGGLNRRGCGESIAAAYRKTKETVSRRRT
jgi:hypothetical protein